MYIHFLNIYNNIKDYKKIIYDTLNYSIENTLKKFKEEYLQI